MRSVLFSGIAWAPAAGECWVVTGPMGSGKTSLALALAKANDTDASIVTFAQQASTANTDWQGARYHSFVEYNFRTVAQSLTYESVNNINPFEVREPEEEARAAFIKCRDKWIPLLHLDGLLNQWTVRLSNGEQRRLLLARALLQQRPLLILDDPFAGLDTTMFGELHTLINTLSAEGKTLVLTVRNPDEIPACTTHRLVLTAAHTIAACEPYTPPTAVATRLMMRSGNPPALPTPVVLQLRNITYSLGGRLLFRHFNWTVHRGERWLIIGPNGSGKSSLLALITGDNPMAYAFDIERFGKRLGRGVPLWEIRHRIATVTPEQQSCLSPTGTLRDIVLSGCFDSEGRPIEPDLTLAEEVMEALGLTALTKTVVADLSAGHCRLALVARALMARPQLLLLDELCMNLEVSERDTVIRLLTTFLDRRPELTALYVAHRADHIPPCFDRTLTLPEDTLA